MMERLTFEGNFCDIAQCDATPGGSYCESGSCTQRKVWERLKAYEDTELDPEMCANYKAFEDEAITKGVPFTRIVALMEADRAGRLVVLPCKVGDTVYRLQYVEESPGHLIVDAVPIKFSLSWIDALGKTVFLTREDAEKALEVKNG